MRRIRLPFRPHLMQIVADWLADRYDNILLLWGVRSGKTIWGVKRDFKFALYSKRPEFGVGWIVGPSYPDLEPTLELFKKIGKNIIADKSVMKHKYVLINGFTIYFKSGEDPDSLIAEGLDFVHVDEGGKMQRLAWDNLLARYKAGQRLKLWCTTTPYYGSPVLSELFFNEETRLPSSAVVTCSSIQALKYIKDAYADDPDFCLAIDEQILKLEKMKKKMSKEFWEERYEGKLGIKWKGLIYPQFDFNTHVVSPFEIPSHWKVVIGIDFGLDSPTVIIFFAQDPKTKIWYAFEEYYQTGTTMGYHAKRVYAIAEKYRVKIQRIYADPTGGARDEGKKQNYIDFINELKKFYPDIERKIGAVFSSVGPGVDTVRNLLERERFRVFSNCKTLIEEFTNTTLERKKYGHGLDCVRYVLASEIRLYPKENEIEEEKEIKEENEYLERIKWVESPPPNYEPIEI